MPDNQGFPTTREMIHLPDTNILIGVITGRRTYASLLQEFIEQRHLLATCSIVVSEVTPG